MVSRKRLEENFERLSVIGLQDGGGITRLAFSEPDWEARNLVMQLMEQAGLIIRVDTFGNIIGRREGTNPEAPVVMIGSHIDSVPNGGNYDGIVGVLGAIEALHNLEEMAVETYHPVEVVVFMAEESSRFGVATLGSKAFCGKVSLYNLQQYKDQQGISLAEAMRQRDLVPEEISQACYKEEIKAFLEIHIEQGKVLETTGRQIGVVTGIAAPTRFRVVINGQADHSGATPMNMRQDALTAGAEIILLVERLAGMEAEYGVVGTTGVIKAQPGAMNVIPGRVELGIDIRSISLESKRRVVDELIVAIDELKHRRNVDIEIFTLADEEPVELPGEMVNLLNEICTKHPYESMLMPSGAGHDAMHLASITHTGMIFIPCRGGISHNPAEWASMNDIVAGTEILLDAIITLAQKEFSWQQNN